MRKSKNPHPKEIAREQEIIKKLILEEYANSIGLLQAIYPNSAPWVRAMIARRYIDLDKEDLKAAIAAAKEVKNARAYLRSVDDNLESELRDIKNGPIYSFALESEALRGISSPSEMLHYLSGDRRPRFKTFGVPENGPAFILRNSEKYPYFYKVMTRRGFTDAGVNEIVDTWNHADDLLQNARISRVIQNEKLLPHPGMTQEFYLKMYARLLELEEQLGGDTDDSRSLKEWPKEKFIKKFHDEDKKPPYTGVIPAGKTFLDLDKFKWVDLRDTANMGKTLSGDYDLFAPYEKFYTRHCGRDVGWSLFSLRVKVGDGWFPIALAAVDKLGSNRYIVKQLKTYRNCSYWALLDDNRKSFDEFIYDACPVAMAPSAEPEEGVAAKKWRDARAIKVKTVIEATKTWLANRGVSPLELKQAVYALLLSDRILVVKEIMPDGSEVHDPDFDWESAYIDAPTLKEKRKEL